MKKEYTYLLLLILIFSVMSACSNIKASQKVAEKENINSQADTTNISQSIEEYYYNKYFDLMVQNSLSTGFSIYSSIEDQYYYSIIKAAKSLALQGDTLVERKMFAFLDSLGNQLSETNPLSITYLNLFKSYEGLPADKLFDAGMKFMEKYKFDEAKVKNGDFDFYENPSFQIFNIFLTFMESSSSEKYNNLILEGFDQAASKSNGHNSLWYLWDYVFPIIKDDWINNRIQFK